MFAYQRKNIFLAWNVPTTKGKNIYKKNDFGKKKMSKFFR